MTGEVEFGEDWVQVVRRVDAFYALDGEPIPWLGYAPKGQESKEWYGVEYGFGGVDMFLYGDAFMIYVYDANANIAGRIEAHEYPSTDTYILYFTTLNQFGRSDGSRYAYHIFAYPNTYNRVSCMFFVDEDEFNQAVNWQ